jgi:hypothetical protein
MEMESRDNSRKPGEWNTGGGEWKGWSEKVVDEQTVGTGGRRRRQEAGRTAAFNKNVPDVQDPLLSTLQRDDERYVIQPPPAVAHTITAQSLLEQPSPDEHWISAA